MVQHLKDWCPVLIGMCHMWTDFSPTPGQGVMVILALGQRTCNTFTPFVPSNSGSRHSETCRAHGRTKALRSGSVPLLLSIKLL